MQTLSDTLPEHGSIDKPFVIAFYRIPVSKAKKSKGSDWVRTSIPNLVRFEPSGKYYIRARVGKKEAHRESLRTTDFKIAISRCAKRLAELRHEAPLRSGSIPLTLWDALKIAKSEVEANPALKRRSVRAYQDVFKSLGPGKEGAVPMTPLGDLTAPELEDWWKETARIFAPATANFHLLVLRRAIKVARDAGAIHKNPAAKLRRMHVPATKLRLITSEQFAALVAALRATDDPEAGAAADWVEFAAYTGCRPEEVNAVRWEHVDLPSWLTIVGGIEGTKNRKNRRIPITPQLADLLDRIQPNPEARTGSVLARGNYGKLLAKVSESIGQRLRRYDLRHLFATRCNEAGIDPATFSRWLGHQDGGALAMRTYVHIHENHDQQAAAKVKF